jgi:hypothetical protein
MVLSYQGIGVASDRDRLVVVPHDLAAVTSGCRTPSTAHRHLQPHLIVGDALDLSPENPVPAAANVVVY